MGKQNGLIARGNYYTIIFCWRNTKLYFTFYKWETRVLSVIFTPLYPEVVVASGAIEWTSAAMSLVDTTPQSSNGVKSNRARWGRS